MHTGGELFEGAVLKRAQLGKVENLFIFFIHEFPRIPQHGAAKVSIAPDTEIGIKAAGKLQQGGNIALMFHTSLTWRHDARNRLEQSRFSRAVRADDAQHIPFLEGKGDIPVGPEFFNAIVAL